MKVIDSFLINKMKLQQDNQALRKLLMEALLQLHHKEVVPLSPLVVSAASLHLVETASAPVPIPQDLETATATAEPIPQGIFLYLAANEAKPTVAELAEAELMEPTVTEFAQFLEGKDIGKRATYFRKVYGPHYAKKENDVAAYTNV
jgi:hypothetical protein